MLKRKLFLFSVIVAFAVTGIAIYLFSQNPVATRSLLLYTNYQSPETITNWIVDTDSNEKWEVGKGLAARRWSPSGNYLMFHTISPSPIEIWISNADGSNIQKIFDNRDYPDLEIKDFDWLSDEMIIVNVVSKTENSGFVYLLNTNSLVFERHNAGNFTKISPNGHFWIQWAGQYELTGLDGKTTPLPDYIRDYYFSPTKERIAYSCAGKYKFSSLCMGNINTLGIIDEQKVSENAFLNAYGEAEWSLDGNYIGFLYSPEQNKEIRFKAIDTANGAIAFDWAFPSTTTRNFWSPRNDKIIDWNGLLLDLKTGQVSNFFEQIHETTPSYIVDWRMVEVP